jgi:hypothetical protein
MALGKYSVMGLALVPRPPANNIAFNLNYLFIKEIN